MNNLSINKRLFVKTFIVGIMVAPILLIIFNIIVDPYGIFQIVSIDNFNKNKPVIATQMRFAKAYAAPIIKPTAVIFGTSRADVGVDPDHPGFHGHRTYNMAMAGAGLYETFNAVKHTYFASGKKLKLAIIGLDILGFNANREEVVFGTEVLDYEEKRLVLSPDDSLYKKLLPDLDRLIFIEALKYSFETITKQKTMEQFKANGMRDLHLNSLVKLISEKGHRYAFSLNEKYYIEKIWAAGKDGRFCFANINKNTSTFDTFRELVRFAKENDIELRFYISPTHARKILALKEAGLWEAFVEFKIGIVNILHEVANQDIKSRPFVLWDFMTINSITSEAVPAADDLTTEMVWYWEMSHFKKPTGDLVLNRVLQYKSTNDTHKDFGILLTPENVNDQLDKTLQDLAIYEQKYPEDAKEIKDLAVQAFENREQSFCTKSYQTFCAANNALQQGERTKALNLFRLAQNEQKEEKIKARSKSLPYREKNISKLISEVLQNNLD